MKALAALALAVALSGCALFELPERAAATDRQIAGLQERVTALDYSQAEQDRRIGRNEQLAGAAFAAAARALEETEANREAMRRMFEASQRK